MKGLLLKDSYMAWKYCRSFLFIVVIFSAFGTLGGENMFFLIYPAFLMGMMPMTLYTYDERERWCLYSRTMPVSGKTYVTAKYVFGLLAVLAYALFIAVLSLVKQAVAGGVLISIPGTICMVLFTGLVGQSVTMPFLMKLGSEKGRLVYLIMIGVMCAVGSLIASSGLLTPAAFLGMKLGFLTVLLIAAAMFVGSWILSVKFYEKREL